MSKSNSVNDSTIPASKRESLITFLAKELRRFRCWAENMAVNMGRAKDLNDVMACQAEEKLRQAETMWNDFYENVKCMLLDHGKPGVSNLSVHDDFSKGSAIITSYLKVIRQQKEKKSTLYDWFVLQKDFESITPVNFPF